MSETSLPASWKEAAPSLLWGTFVFAFGFETVVRLFEGHLLHASVGFIATLALTSVLIFWSKIGSTWPQWAATANSVATDARWWIVVFLGLFLYVAFPKGELTWTQAIMAGSLAVLIVILAFALSLRKRSGNSLREDASTTRLFSGQKAIAGEPIYYIAGMHLDFNKLKNDRESKSMCTFLMRPVRPFVSLDVMAQFNSDIAPMINSSPSNMRQVWLKRKFHQVSLGL